MFRSLVVMVFVLVLTAAPLVQAGGIEAPKQVDDKLWVMGAPSQDDVRQFADQGGQVVISLLSADELNQMVSLRWFSQYNLAFYNIPVNGAEGVTFSNVRLLDKLLLQHGDKNVLVHCSSANRVGALFALRAAWLDGQSNRDALSLGRRYGLTDLKKQVSEMLSQ
ncbi:MAG: serine/threonine protein phosphatase [Pseudomonadota bacterium]